MTVKDHEYTLYVADNMQRVYSEDTLPDLVKAAWSMIKAFPRNNVEIILHSMGIYVNTHDERLDDIGWQSLPDTYIVVLPREYVVGLEHG